MAAEKFEHYLPLVASVRQYLGQTKRFSKPLFPGYVFAKVSPNLKPRIFQQDLLARAIVVVDEATFVRQLGEVRIIIASGYSVSVFPLLTKGRPVEIVGGPLHGVKGIVVDPASPQRVVVAIDVLRQGLLVTVPIENLRPSH